jgi:hypothetical protein
MNCARSFDALDGILAAHASLAVFEVFAERVKHPLGELADWRLREVAALVAHVAVFGWVNCAHFVLA